MSFLTKKRRYQFLGPGTFLKKRLDRGDQGINRLDHIARQHDIDYSMATSLEDKWKADDKMVEALKVIEPDVTERTLMPTQT